MQSRALRAVPSPGRGCARRRCRAPSGAQTRGNRGRRADSDASFMSPSQMSSGAIRRMCGPSAGSCSWLETPEGWGSGFSSSRSFLISAAISRRISLSWVFQREASYCVTLHPSRASSSVRCFFFNGARLTDGPVAAASAVASGARGQGGAGPLCWCDMQTLAIARASPLKFPHLHAVVIRGRFIVWPSSLGTTGTTLHMPVELEKLRARIARF